jgi:hypothetical protein
VPAVPLPPVPAVPVPPFDVPAAPPIVALEPEVPATLIEPALPAVPAAMPPLPACVAGFDEPLAPPDIAALAPPALLPPFALPALLTLPVPSPSDPEVSSCVAQPAWIAGNTTASTLSGRTDKLRNRMWKAELRPLDPQPYDVISSLAKRCAWRPRCRLSFLAPIAAAQRARNGAASSSDGRKPTNVRSAARVDV